MAHTSQWIVQHCIEENRYVNSSTKIQMVCFFIIYRRFKFFEYATTWASEAYAQQFDAN